MLEKDLLDEMARAKADIQSFQLGIDGARTNRIAQIMYKRAQDRLKELVTEHKSLMREWLKEKLLDGKEVF